jgi:hypothetical protein
MPTTITGGNGDVRARPACPELVEGLPFFFELVPDEVQCFDKLSKNGVWARMTAIGSILGALVLAFIAYKVLMGLVRVGVIILIIAVLAGLWQQGAIG